MKCLMMTMISTMRSLILTRGNVAPVNDMKTAFGRLFFVVLSFSLSISLTHSLVCGGYILLYKVNMIVVICSFSFGGAFSLHARGV